MRASRGAACLLLAFIVGVPPGPQCEGSGDEIPDCLDHTDMVEEVDSGSSGTRLRPSCSTSIGEAFPPRRLVEVAWHFGDRALVRSICAPDLGPAVRGLTDKLHGLVDAAAVARELEAENDTTDADGDTVLENPCRCVAPCRMIESLGDLRSCGSAGRYCYEPDGPGTGCADPLVDADGLMHTLCEIPQAGTLMSPCSAAEPTACGTSGITHAPAGEGWYYMGRGWEETGTGFTSTEPVIHFTPGMEPAEGSDLQLVCCE